MTTHSLRTPIETVRFFSIFIFYCDLSQMGYRTLHEPPCKVYLTTNFTDLVGVGAHTHACDARACVSPIICLLSSKRAHSTVLPPARRWP